MRTSNLNKTIELRCIPEAKETQSESEICLSQISVLMSYLAFEVFGVPQFSDKLSKALYKR